MNNFSQHTLTKGTILVVDDNPANLKLLTKMLTVQHYKVRVATNGTQAFRSVQANLPDLIVLDIMMTPLSGYEICEQLKADPLAKHVPIIFLSAKAEVIDKVKAFSVGGIDFITKPFATEEVLIRIENQLKLSRLSKQLAEQNIQLFQEIQNRVAAEIALKESEKKYRALVEASQDMIWSVDAQGYYTFVNPAVQEIYGYRPEEMIGRKFTDFETPEQAAEDLQVFQKLLKREPIFQYETTHLNKDGKPIYLLFNAIPLLDEFGNLIGTTGSASDITKRKQAEAEVLRSKDLLESIFNEAADGIFLVDPETNLILDCNRRAVELFEAKSKEELINIQGYTLQKESFTQEQVKTLITEVNTSGIWSQELEYITKQGKTFWGSLAVKQILVAGQKINLVRVTNITMRKTAEEALKASEQRFRAIFNAMFQFIGLMEPNGTLLEANETALKFAGIDDPKEVVGQPFWQAPWWRISEATQTQLKEAIVTAAHGQLVRYEVDVMGAEDTIITIDFSIKPIFDDSGKVILLIPEGRDISNAKTLEREVALREALLNGFFLAAPLGLSIIDRELRFVRVNEPMALINGLPASEHIGKTLYEVIPNMAATVELLCQRVWSTHQPILNLEVSGEVPSQPGVMRDWTVSYFPIPGTAEQLSRIGVVVVEITERKRAEMELLSTRARLEYLMTYNPAIIFSCIFGGDYAATFMSPNVVTVFGYEAENFIGHADFWAARVHPEDLLNIPTDVLLIQESSSYEYRFRHADGTYRWTYVQLKLVKDPAGQPVEFVGYWIDISARKQAEEEELRKSEITNRALLNAIPDMMFRCKVDGTCVDFKPAKDRIALPESTTLSIGQKSQDAFPSSLGERMLRAYQLAVFFNQVQIVEYELPINNKIYDYEARIVACGGDEVIAMVRDISERKQVERVLKESAKRERAIAKILQRMRQTLDLETIFRATTSELKQVLKCDRVAIYQFNPDWSGKIVCESVSQGWIVLVQEQQNNPNLTEGSLEHEACTVKNLGNEFLEVEDSYLRETKGGAYSLGARYLCISDIYETHFDPCYIKLLERFQARAYVTVPIFCGNQLWGLLASYQNSGPRQWTEGEINIAIQIGTQLGVAVQQAELLAQTQHQSAALKKAVIAADAANQAKSEFLASMSHELRTPLNAILGFSKMMSRDQSLAYQQQESLGIINRAGEHLLDLINDILEMSKIEAGRTTLNVGSFDLLKLLMDLKEMLQLTAKSKGLQFIFDVAKDVPQYVQTDEGKLRQVLINILGNAIKFTERGHVTLRVRTQGQSHEKMAVDEEVLAVVDDGLPTTRHPSSRLLYFEIVDTGPGIATEELNLLFEPFGQTEAGRKSQQGTGLGLPISRKFVQLMGGDIQVRSVVGQGSVFSFDIQVMLVERPELKFVKSSQKIIALAPNQPEFRLLVVDDAKESRFLLVKLFTELGFIVREAQNGQEAITIWGSWHPQLILMDMQMPVMDGYAATKQIKSTIQGQETVIIALTANAFEEERQVIATVGCDDFIGKPFREALLLEKVGQHLKLAYIYEGENGEPEKNNNNNSLADILTQADLKEELAQMPSQWLTQLHRAACNGSDDEIFELVAQISSTYHSLAQTLRDLASNFHFKTIIQLTQDFIQ